MNPTKGLEFSLLLPKYAVILKKKSLLFYASAMLSLTLQEEHTLSV
jgi:hypothetical protein